MRQSVLNKVWNLKRFRNSSRTKNVQAFTIDTKDPEIVNACNKIGTKGTKKGRKNNPYLILHPFSWFSSHRPTIKAEPSRTT